MTRQLIKEGADYIKITATGGSTRTSFPLLPSFNLDELRAITYEAHKLGKLTASHCVSTQGIVNSLDAGVDMIIHCVFKEPDGTDVFRDDLAERLGEQGTFINPTLHVFRSKIWMLQLKKEREGLSPDEQVLLDHDIRDFETRIDHCRRLIEKGLKVAVLGPAHVGQRVVESHFLVAPIVAPRTVGHADPQLEFLLVEGATVELQRHRTDHRDSALAPTELRRQGDRR